VIVARRFLITGRVQGVGFRFFADDVARAENLAGYVRNLPDGRVEAVAEGDEESVLRFERAMHRGPRGALVERVETDTIPVEHRDGFGIRS
jgi:acylphosphatase